MFFYIATPEGTHYTAFLNILSAAGELLRVAPLVPAKACRQQATTRQASGLDLEEEDGQTSGYLNQGIPIHFTEYH